MTTATLASPLPPAPPLRRLLLGDKMGFAIGAGVRIYLDMLAAATCSGLQATYVDGMVGYLLNNGNSDLIGANRNTTAVRSTTRRSRTFRSPTAMRSWNVGLCQTVDPDD